MAMSLPNIVGALRALKSGEQNNVLSVLGKDLVLDIAADTLEEYLGSMLTPTVIHSLAEEQKKSEAVLEESEQ